MGTRRPARHTVLPPSDPLTSWIHPHDLTFPCDGIRRYDPACLWKDLPATPSEENLQVFKNGELIARTTDYTVEGNDITLAAADGDFLQLLYLTAVPSTDAYKESQSGLYISDLLPEEELTGLASCDHSLWEIRPLLVSRLEANLLKNAATRTNRLKPGHQRKLACY